MRKWIKKAFRKPHNATESKESIILHPHLCNSPNVSNWNALPQFTLHNEDSFLRTQEQGAPLVRQTFQVAFAGLWISLQ
jgi:hypothetical protein